MMRSGVAVTPVMLVATLMAFSDLPAQLGSKATALAWHLGALALLNTTPGLSPQLWGA
jgi:hypothetical protein